MCRSQPLSIFTGKYRSYFIDTNYQCWTCGGGEHITVPEKEKYVTDQEAKLVASRAVITPNIANIFADITPEYILA